MGEAPLETRLETKVAVLEIEKRKNTIVSDRCGFERMNSCHRITEWDHNKNNIHEAGSGANAEAPATERRKAQIAALENCMVMPNTVG